MRGGDVLTLRIQPESGFDLTGLHLTGFNGQDAAGLTAADLKHELENGNDVYTLEVTVTAENGDLTPAVGAEFDISASDVKHPFEMYKGAFTTGIICTTLVNGREQNWACAGDTVEVRLSGIPTGYRASTLRVYEDTNPSGNTWGYMYAGSSASAVDNSWTFTVRAEDPEKEYDKLCIFWGASAISYSGTIQTVPADWLSELKIWRSEYSEWSHDFTYTVESRPELYIFHKIELPEGCGLEKATIVYQEDPEHPITITDPSSYQVELRPGGMEITFYLVDTSTVDRVTEIGSAEDLLRLAETVNLGADYSGVEVRLDQDVDLSKVDWTPIGTTMAPFTGTFLGNGHTITVDLNSDGRYVGLFGCVENAAIQDLTVAGTITSTTDTNLQGTQVVQTGADTYVGGVAAWAENTAFTNCRSQVDIYAKCANAGGIAGACSGTITGCTNEGNFTIVQVQSDPDYANNDPNGTGGIGGIVGYVIGRRYSSSVSTLTIDQCYNSGSFFADFGISRTTSSTTGVQWEGEHMSGYFGGLVGARYFNTALVLKNSANSGDMTGAMKFAGGLVGGKWYNLTWGSSAVWQAEISNCYSTGYIHSTGKYDKRGWMGYIGGLSGWTGEDDKFTNCYVSVKAVQDYPYSLVNGDICGVQSDELWMGGADKSGAYGPAKIAALSGTTLQETLSAGGNESIWQADINGLNGIPANTYPLLWWQSADPGSEVYTITFDVTPPEAEVTVTGAGGVCTPNVDGTYSLHRGAYTYTVSAPNCKSVSGSFNVSRAQTITVSLEQSATVTFRVSPASASFTLNSGAAVIEPVRQESANGWAEYTYTLIAGRTYIYSAYANGYNGTTREYAVAGDGTVEIVLTEKPAPEQVVSDVYGDGNVGKTHTITRGGIYQIGEDATGVLTVNTTEAVTLLGDGVGLDNMYEDLYINCTQSGTYLTLQDVYISNASGGTDPKMTNMVNFSGRGSNTLNFKGTNILDQDTGASGFATIHVSPSTSLTVTGGTAYIYKRDQGAGIGGNGGAKGSEGEAPENNGSIYIQDAVLYIKGSMQGALIGTGAGAVSAGPIDISNSELYLMANARGSAIGGGAGSTAATGGNVNVYDSTLTINVDWSGAAVGGGGYDGGNDAFGGTLNYTSGSIRAYIDANAAEAWGVDGPGVHDNKAVTAAITGGSGDLQLLIFDTDNLSKAARTFNVVADGKTIYTRGLHDLSYVNESELKANVQYTIDNWAASGDSYLYLYVSGKDQDMTINGEKFHLAWDEDEQTFEVTNEAGEVVTPGGGAGSVEIPKEEETEIKAETTIENGKATTTVDSEALLAVLEKVTANTQIVVSADIPDDETVTETVTVLTRSDVGAIAESKATLKVSSPLADVVLSTEALQDLAGEKGHGSEPVTITASLQENGTRIEIAANGKALDEVAGGVLVSLPVAKKDLTAGTVMVLVDEDGNETVIKKSVAGENSVTARLSGSCTVKAVNNAKSFDDVKSTDWYASAVAFATGHELFQGVSETEFAPTQLMTRAMLVTVLHRLEDTPEALTAHPFDDVGDGLWYTDAVSWANENGIVTGTGAGFDPNGSVTREQLATILYRYAQYLGLDVSVSGDLDRFQDSAQTSAWASEAMRWAVGAGIITGKSDTVLDPGGSATRAEVATMLQRSMSQIVK